MVILKVSINFDNTNQHTFIFSENYVLNVMVTSFVVKLCYRLKIDNFFFNFYIVYLKSKSELIVFYENLYFII